MKPLKSKERCPIHRGFWCCGRENKSGLRQRKGHTRIAPGVTRIEDEHHPDGFRIRRSPAAMRTLLAKKIIAQDGLCGICGLELTDMRDVVPDHIEPRGLGGSRRNDDESNIQAAHSSCNFRKGSIRIKEEK